MQAAQQGRLHQRRMKTAKKGEKDIPMTQYERMQAGLLYDANDPEILALQMPFLDRLREFNQLRATDYAQKERYMKEVFAACGEGCYIELPFRANWGGHHLSLGSNVYVNFSLTLVDDGRIFVGDKTMIGPNVTIATANHPIEPGLRARALQYNKDVVIGGNVWIGASAVILPGVTIGQNSVIGAGSVVSRDIPANVVALGNPCRVLRPIGEQDREFFYRAERIDWENL